MKTLTTRIFAALVCLLAVSVNKTLAADGFPLPRNATNILYNLYAGWRLHPPPTFDDNLAKSHGMKPFTEWTEDDFRVLLEAIRASRFRVDPDALRDAINKNPRAYAADVKLTNVINELKIEQAKQKLSKDQQITLNAFRTELDILKQKVNDSSITEVELGRLKEIQTTLNAIDLKQKANMFNCDLIISEIISDRRYAEHILSGYQEIQQKKAEAIKEKQWQAEAAAKQKRTIFWVVAISVPVGIVVVIFLFILAGKETGCPQCGKPWARIRQSRELLDSEAFFKTVTRKDRIYRASAKDSDDEIVVERQEQAHFIREWYLNKYCCKFCNATWTAKSCEEHEG